MESGYKNPDHLHTPNWIVKKQITYFLATDLASESASWTPFLTVSIRTATCLKWHKANQVYRKLWWKQIQNQYVNSLCPPLKTTHAISFYHPQSGYNSVLTGSPDDRSLCGNPIETTKIKDMSVYRWTCDHPEERSESLIDINQSFMRNAYGATCQDSSSATPGVKGLKTHNSAWEWKKRL